jgi:hypothetical protein
MDPAESAEHQERSRFPVAFAAGAGVVLLLLCGLILLTKWTRPRGSTAVEHFPLGAQEQAYAQQIHFKDIRMARAANFLNQEFTYVAGTISNDGARTLRGLEVSMEFHDPFHQVILRETEQLITPAMHSLEAGQQSDFKITLEHVPAEWDQQYPSIRVTGLILK